MGDDAHCHELFTVVTAVHHKGICEPLDDGALGFAESLDSVTPGGMRDVDRGSDLNIIAAKIGVSFVNCIERIA